MRVENGRFQVPSLPFRLPCRLGHGQMTSYTLNSFLSAPRGMPFDRRPLCSHTVVVLCVEMPHSSIRQLVDLMDDIVETTELFQFGPFCLDLAKSPFLLVLTPCLDRRGIFSGGEETAMDRSMHPTMSTVPGKTKVEI